MEMPQVILAAVKKAFEAYMEIDSEITGRKPHHKEGVLVLENTKECMCSIVVAINPTESEWNMDYVNFAKEKAGRLFINLSMGHRSSAQSADIPNKKFPGAIKAREWIISLSGFSYWPEEAVALHAAYCLDLITLEEAREIASPENKIFNILLEACPK